MIAFAPARENGLSITGPCIPYREGQAISIDPA